MRNLWTYLSFAIFLLTIAASSFPSNADAAKVKSVTFTPVLIEICCGHFDAVGASTTCPDGSVTKGGILSMNPSTAKGSVTGNWRILQEEGAVTGPDGGHFTSLQVSNSMFEAKADFTSGDFGTGTSLICEDAPIPASVSFRGRCGDDGIVVLVASNGMTGRYEGDVTCIH